MIAQKKESAGFEALLDRLRRITTDGRWIPEIDGLRFVAIASVFLGHLAGQLGKLSHGIPIEQRYRWMEGILINFDRGVEIFFVISGLILAMPLHVNC
jgi:peptidoglycan/LPS O-acetylase OafA/YrhL